MVGRDVIVAGNQLTANDEGLPQGGFELTRAQVELMLDRFEEHTTTGNRPSALIQIRAGVDGNGKINAWDWRSFGGVGFHSACTRPK